MTKIEIRKKVIEELKACQEDGDTETAHVRADDLIFFFLISLGYRDVAAEYEKVDKWYA